MRIPFQSPLIALATCLIAPAVALAGANASQFTLRVHVFQTSEHTHYFNQAINSVDGNGRANLFENGEPTGFDYSFLCGDRVMTSSGYETYLAKWKKKGSSLEILLPVMGKPGAVHTCELKVDMKNFAYYRRNGVTYTEPSSVYKEWMEKHQYDPEHGKDEPIRLEPAPGASTPVAPPQPPQQ